MFDIKDFAACVDELSQRYDALDSTLKTVNGMAQLALQQLSVFRKGLAETKSLIQEKEKEVL